MHKKLQRENNKELEELNESGSICGVNWTDDIRPRLQVINGKGKVVQMVQSDKKRKECSEI